MNELQKQTKAFIESQCRIAGCPREAKALTEGYALMCDWDGYFWDKVRKPIIVCADMGMGKTSFIQMVNSTGKLRGKDLEVCDIPGIWGEPDKDGNMSLVDGWEKIALDTIDSMKDTDVVTVTSDPKMVNALLARERAFFLAYKDDIDSVRKTIEARTATHFANVVRDFGDYIRKSSIPESLKGQMLNCSPEALVNLECAKAIPESIIATDQFQNDDRYRHWHDMFKLKTGNRSVSIMDRNLENLAERIKFFDSINSMLCRKIRLKDGEYLSSDRVAREILGFALK